MRLVTLIRRYVIGYLLFWGPILGAVYGFMAPVTPWWAWACVAVLALQLVVALLGLIINGYAGASPSTSPWEQVKAAEEQERFEQMTEEWRRTKPQRRPRK
jgi:hypothetical protein